jgi:hypothetical protein
LERWPNHQRHEMSLLFQALGSWVGISLEAWMSVCVCPVFVLSCVGSGILTDWVLPTLWFTVSELIPNGNRPERLIYQGRRRSWNVGHASPNFPTDAVGVKVHVTK